MWEMAGKPPCCEEYEEQMKEERTKTMQMEKTLQLLFRFLDSSILTPPTIEQRQLIACDQSHTQCHFLWEEEAMCELSLLN